MSFDTLGEVNYLAAAVAALAWFVAGAAWYARPVLGRVWMRSLGIEAPQAPNPIIFVGTLVLYFVTAVATAMLAIATGSDTFAEGIVLGLVVGIGYAVASTGVSALFEPRAETAPWFWVTASFGVIGYTLVAVIVSVWR